EEDREGAHEHDRSRARRPGPGPGDRAYDGRKGRHAARAPPRGGHAAPLGRAVCTEVVVSEITAVYPGTFDPVTYGHLDIIRRGARLFPRVIVAILQNPAKDPLFSLTERTQMVAQATADLANVHVDAFEGLLVDYARSQNARVIVRGLRAVSDFE